MCLMKYLFLMSPRSTNITFQEIAHKTKQDIGQVEFLLLKAMSLRIIDGVIDQIAGCISITWVHARILNRKDIASLSSKVCNWEDELDEMLKSVGMTVQSMHST
eukprot:NODE_1089_length_1286_cov_163.619240_g893_i0.p1 GENE.NODE_1089_length_1286_cov_163.619240_g893_i0~~NODE_1089_length_1286_cov_163.619240_g893_i0.p1  ORF type:complete len:104 (+),score=10.87 NODE_1089_length_1286_cov_163.619240_g893_i0:904-1215(+)